MKNALTIDVEDWYQTQDFHFDIEKWSSFEDRVVGNTEKILELLSKHNIKATFFVLGYIAKKHPQLIKKIHSAGNEIGSHGMWHKMINQMSKQEFTEDIRASKQLLEDITGDKVNYFRASSWSMTRKTLWAFEALCNEGYTLDSSMQPFATPLSGDFGVPYMPFYPVINGKKQDILEFPVTVMPLHKFCFPFSGGLYLRVLPFSIIKYCLKKINEKESAMIYTHPWEIDEMQPRLKALPHIKLAHYYNLKSTEKKLKMLFEGFEFTTLSEIVKENSYKQHILS